MSKGDEVEELLHFHRNFSLVTSTSDGKSGEGSCENRQEIQQRNKELEDLKKFQQDFSLVLNDNQHRGMQNGIRSTSNSRSQSCKQLTIPKQTVPNSLAIPRDDGVSHETSSAASSSSSRQQQLRPHRKKRRPLPGFVSFESCYELTGEILGTGARSSVLTCRSKKSGSKYAVKVIPKAGNSDDVRDRVLKEVEILYVCKNNRNFLQLIHFFENEKEFHLVLEKMAGPLLGLIQRREKFTEREASLVTREVASALAFLHERGIAHRDLKPENILCERYDKVIPVKICDFDLSNMIPKLPNHGQTPITTPNLLTPVGSAEFMAPEVLDTLRGEVFSYDKKCDLWSLGVLVYMMLSGRPPFYGRCGKDCGWEKGEICEECQSMLLGKIRRGEYSFGAKEWGSISSDAKDLISRLLERDTEKRLSAIKVLTQPWLEREMAPETPLFTPGVLRRNPSVHEELSHFAASCLRCSRQLSFHDNQASDGSHSRDPVPFTLSPPGNSELAVRRSAHHHW